MMKGVENIMKKTIVIIGTLDTKEAEAEYLKEQIRKLRCTPLLLDISLREYKPKIVKPDISNEDVAKASGLSIKDVSSKERGEAAELMSKGASRIIKDLWDSGKINGVIGYGGGTGLSMLSLIMKNLPFGAPKLIVTTMAEMAGRAIGAKDIVIFPSITDLAGGEKINRIEAITLANAAGAIVGMVKAKPQLPSEKPLIVMSQFGVTTPCVQKAKEILENHGYEVVTFHAVGTGGRAMEDLIRSGIAVAVLDVTTHELVDELVGGVCKAGQDRMEAAGEKGIPQVILPGALDMVNFYEPSSVPEKFKDRRFYYHTPIDTLMRTSKEESAELGKIFASKLNKAKGPTVMLIPMKGWSEYDKEGGVKTVDYYGKETDQPWFDPEADAAFIEALEAHVDRSKQNLEILKVDYHINDPKLAELSALILDSMIKGKWKKGVIKNFTPT